MLLSWTSMLEISKSCETVQTENQELNNEWEDLKM